MGLVMRVFFILLAGVLSFWAWFVLVAVLGVPVGILLGMGVTGFVLLAVAWRRG